VKEEMDFLHLALGLTYVADAFRGRSMSMARPRFDGSLLGRRGGRNTVRTFPREREPVV
jgi:hypothetical protein